jgi:hypothetical protein
MDGWMDGWIGSVSIRHITLLLAEIEPPTAEMEPRGSHGNCIRHLHLSPWGFGLGVGFQSEATYIINIIIIIIIPVNAAVISLRPLRTTYIIDHHVTGNPFLTSDTTDLCIFDRL